MVLMVVLGLHDELLATPQPITSGFTNMRIALGHLTERTSKLTCQQRIDQAGWEGSTADSSILKDALSRPNGLKVLKGYPNAKGFLMPYRGQHYHLQEWRGAENAPETLKEYCNMKHSSVQNVIERAFSLLKGRWAILCGKSYYPIQVQCRTIMDCCLLRNLINREMTYIDELDDEDDGDSTHVTTSGDDIT
ncbi:putative nuclease HARBI1 [Cucumis melo var. makuwa]|uniref:Nuclease HARBI1 n=1 Tax=Cucumis melo var. makuwa TaxID=1194695 RepID=A0A5A7SZR6_CUCMM|nr:putative nuclease HARBI1 [Cucumis melo var. makuwa]